MPPYPEITPNRGGILIAWAILKWNSPDVLTARYDRLSVGFRFLTETILYNSINCFRFWMIWSYTS